LDGLAFVDETARKRERCIESLLLDGSTHLWVADSFFPLIKSVLQRLPLEALEQLMEKEFCFLAPDRCCGRVTRLDHNYRSGKLLVFLSPELLDQPSPEGIQTVIAHELAHVVLGHEESGSADARQEAAEGECQADDLIQRWGFDLTSLNRK
jgi:hypothetical protein